MPRLDRRFAPLVYGVIQSGLTTAVASGIATWKLTPSIELFLVSWATAWLIAWAAMLPVVVFASPFILRLVNLLVRPTLD